MNECGQIGEPCLLCGHIRATFLSHLEPGDLIVVQMAGKQPANFMQHVSKNLREMLEPRNVMVIVTDESTYAMAHYRHIPEKVN